ncbi:MAG: zinc-binding alcohol dehydrogenase family protein [Candidatus Thioglobus sp.]|uniref:zinc-binding alcohol dehydrogenase family protein n=1 Tax=Candidatus Thioglobus sp. TaxID=2026721 RepID=UPI0026116808|nr:zinc-binding alcohol dehydrogenase family protein [Candidatus Thioglobus sp.]MDC9727596.1 zinc-binding alcohol dehydrogenase family protein [Candidatus Thioglobus sp.]
MQAIGYNGSEFVEFGHTLADPQGQDLLIEVKAISINPIDSKVKQTVVDASSPKILGFDCAGVVRAVGDQVGLFKVGDEVYYAGDITRDGSNSTHQLVDERIVALKPKTLNFAQAAALPLTSITAWESLFDRLKITQADKDKTLLLIGAAGGVGSMAIQFAKQVIGINVIATASRTESKDWCVKMGANVVLDHQNLAEQFSQQSLPNPDYILCMGVPDDYFGSMLEIINPQGSICLLANAREAYDLNLLKAKSITLVWEMMFTRAMFQTNDMIEQHKLLNTVAKLIDQGELISPLTQRLSPISVDTITQAHTLIEQGDMLGKLVISNAD